MGYLPQSLGEDQAIAWKLHPGPEPPPARRISTGANSGTMELTLVECVRKPLVCPQRNAYGISLRLPHVCHVALSPLHSRVDTSRREDTPLKKV
jgi:hypothetical protein